jgi:hypothetical protein
MKWTKLGKIFDPTEHRLPNGCVEFAQSPQSLVFPDFVRLYYSTRQRDEKNGKFFSHIAFVDFDKSFSKILRVSEDTVIPLGELGTFDEHGIFPINVLKDGDRVVAYTCGWSRRVSVSVETSTGFAVSRDGGETFTKVGRGPIMSSSLHEPFLVGDSFVIKEESGYHMWYIYGSRWIDNDQEEAARVYKIAYARSADGLDWQRNGVPIIPNRLNEDECQALPTVLRIGNRYHMYFCYREAIGFRKDPTRGYRLGYAYSDDNRVWTRNDDMGGIELSTSGWDSAMMCYPHIFRCDDQIYLAYNGNEFGKFGFGLARLEAE